MSPLSPKPHQVESSGVRMLRVWMREALFDGLTSKGFQKFCSGRIGESGHIGIIGQAEKKAKEPTASEFLSQGSS